MDIMQYLPQFGQNVDQPMPQDDALMQMELKRRLAQADALRNAQAPEGQMVSGHYVAPSWTQYAANLVNKYQGGKQADAAMKQYGEAQTAKAQKYADLLGQSDNAKFQQGLAQMPEFAPELVKSRLSGMTKQDNPMIVPAGSTVYQGGQAVYTAPKEVAEKSMFGTVSPSDFTPASLAKFAQTKQWTDLQPVAKEMTPYQIEELKLRKAEIGKKDAANFDSATVDMLAEQALAGDKSVFSGRGMTGANIGAVRQRMNQKMVDRGMSGADIAAKNAEFMGFNAAERTAGVKGANVALAAGEFQNLLPLASQASLQVQRSGFLPFGKVQVMFDEQTNDPALRQFAAANNGIVNTYARAISPTGVPTVSDKDHARKLLSTAFDQKSYQATLDMLQKEIAAAQAAPKHVRESLRAEMSGKGSNTGLPSQDAIAAELARRGRK